MRVPLPRWRPDWRGLLASLVLLAAPGHALDLTDLTTLYNPDCVQWAIVGRQNGFQPGRSRFNSWIRDPCWATSAAAYGSCGASRRIPRGQICRFISSGTVRKS